MSQQVRRPKAETEAAFVDRKTAKDLGTPVDKVTVGHANQESSVKKGIQGVSQRIEQAANNIKEAVMGSDKPMPKMQEGDNSTMKKAGEEAKKMVSKMEKGMEENMDKMKKNMEKGMDKMEKGMQKMQKGMEKGMDKMKQMGKENKKMPEMDWEEHYKSAESDIKKSLKQGQSEFSSQLEKVYQGMLKNCLKQSEDEPHKLQKCWQEFSTKMQPVYQKLQERSSESAETLKKCFESKQNAKECIQEGIKFGQHSLSDATNSIKAYLA